MMLILHIVVAVLGLGVAAFSLILPSKRKINLSYSLLGLTLASGTYLVVMAPAHITTACLAGLTYTITMLVLTSVSRRRLVRQMEEI